MKKRRRNWRALRLEYWFACIIVPLLRYIRPQTFIKLFNLLGTCVYFVMPERRKIALDNLRRIYGNGRNERELKRIARASVSSLLLGVAENLWFQRVLHTSAGVRRVEAMIEDVGLVSNMAKPLHESAGGCIFITPHRGCYAVLPYLFAAAGIPLTIPVQELGNDHIQRRWCPVNAARSLDGEIFIPKTNSIDLLRAALRRGRSVGMMADQRTMRGLAVEFLGTTAAATPIPALLAVGLNRPIVVGACCRESCASVYKLILHQPIWADQNRNAKEEIVRLTEELNRKMGEIIRQYPDQYLWMHNRWKPYRVRRHGARNLSLPIGS